MRALSTRVANISKQINPSITKTRVSGQPPSFVDANTAWISRKIRLNLSGAANSPVVVSMGQVMKEILLKPATTVGNVRVSSMKVWNTTNQASSTNFVSLATDVALVNNDYSIEVTDFGNSANLPGVGVMIPGPVQQQYVAPSSATTSKLGTIIGDPQGPSGSITVSQSYCVDVTVLVQY